MTCLCCTYILFDDQINKNHFFLTKTFGVGPRMASEVSVVLIPWVNQSSSMPMLLAVEEAPNAPAGLFLRPEFGGPLLVFMSHNGAGTCACFILSPR